MYGGVLVTLRVVAGSAGSVPGITVGSAPLRPQ
jgi:hypothetical protein